MEKLQLKVTANTAVGNAEKLRKQGMIPAVLYGHNLTSQHLAASQNEFEKVFRKAGESTLVEVVTEDGKTHNVLIQEVQRHYLTNLPIHVDFYEVKMTEKLTATVQLEFVGESDAVKLHGGTLVRVLNEVEVECFPADLPHNLEVDISKLKTINDTLTVKDIKVSDKVTIKAELDDTVANIQPPRDVEAEMQDQVGDIAQVEGLADKTEEEPAAAEPAE